MKNTKELNKLVYDFNILYRKKQIMETKIAIHNLQQEAKSRGVEL